MISSVIKSGIDSLINSPVKELQLFVEIMFICQT
jgi:hypothetical protein